MCNGDSSEIKGIGRDRDQGRLLYVLHSHFEAKKTSKDIFTSFDCQMFSKMIFNVSQ